MKNNGLENVDSVITTRELARMIKQANIDFVNLKETEFDDPMGEATGAGAIFGTTGGVMEAALRTAYETVTGKELEKVDFEDVRGDAGIKKASIYLNGKEIKVVVAHGLGNARKVLDEIKDRKSRLSICRNNGMPRRMYNGGRTANSKF